MRPWTSRESLAATPPVTGGRADDRLRSLEEDRTEDVGALEQLRRRSVVANLALLHEVRVLRDREGDVDRLLDQDDRRPARVDALHDLEELLNDERRETERKLVDHQQLGIGDQGMCERQHQLLAYG